MSSLWSFRWFSLYFLFGQLNLSYIRAAWPSSNLSNIQLLGLFSDIENTSETTISSLHCRAMFKAAIILSREYNITIEGQLISWQSAQTGGDVMNALSNTCQSISNANIVGIVGPQLSRESHFIAPFAAKIGIPVISYASTDPELSDRSAYPAFYRTVSSDSVAALAIVQLFIRFNWTSCLIIYQNGAFGSGGAKAINEAFNNKNLTVTEMIVFDITTRTIQGDLKKVLINVSTRLVLIWATPDHTELILQNALNNDLVGPQFTWILSSNIRLNSFNPIWYKNLSGMLIVEPVVGNVVNVPVNTTLLDAAYRIWERYEPESFPKSNDVDYYALFAFDAAWTLIQSLKKFCSTKIHNSSSCISFINTSYCFDRYFLNSNSFFDMINNITFLGVSGSIQFGHNVTDRISGTYYIAKNVQYSSDSLSYVPVLVWSDVDGWISHTQKNKIVWPGNALESPTGYAALSGITLRIAVRESVPFTINSSISDKFGKNITKLRGYVPDLIELLQQKMGFISNITLVSSNETYDGLIDAIANDEYDMVVADMTITAGRRKKVGFSSSIFDNSLRIVIRKTSIDDIDLLSFLRPFSFKLWITLLIVSIYAGFLIYFLEGEQNEALQNKSIISLIGMSMWYSVGTILGYGVDFHVRTAAGRLLTVGLYILSLVLVAAYTAALASDLTISKSKNIISGIDDVKNGKISFSRIGIIGNSSIEEYYLREISKENRNFHLLKSEQEIYSKLLDNTIDASIMDSGVLEYSIGKMYCNLTLVGTDFDKSAFAIVVPKDWLYQHSLDISILSLRESGVLDDLKRKWFQSDYCSHSSTTFTSMPIESMVGLFITVGIVSFLSILLFAWKQRFFIKHYLFKLTDRKDTIRF